MIDEFLPVHALTFVEAFVERGYADEALLRKFKALEFKRKAKSRKQRKDGSTSTGFIANPSDQRFRAQTDEEFDGELRNSALSPEDFEKFLEQFMFEHGAELDPANRESVIASMREINEIALNSKAHYEKMVKMG
ncbi:hypothetical protein [Tunturiibacter gelidiferens]|uniref:hypothetical protein n=1 Tax=Tunturiibacter gelidiferens TaxID=3069689 RepID=UPI003D9AB609